MTATQRTLTLVATVALLAAAGGSVRATVVLALGFDEMAAQADRVVLGDVTSVTARWVERDGAKTIETVIDIAVDDELGNVSAAPVARIVQPGGAIGDVGLAVAGMPEFRAGERVLVFLRVTGADEQGQSVHSVVGMAQGKFIVLPRLGGGFDAIQQLGPGFGVAAAGEDGVVRAVEDQAPLRMDLGEALARVRTVRGEVTP
ncbi:MAG: hypothetical protein HY907_20265 [Deltaproteobacteria bacterium]|nr:hypothetical protein [Deltaproteobacteria bacterium]